MRVMMVLYYAPPMAAVASTRLARLIQGLPQRSVEPVLVVPGGEDKRTRETIHGREVEVIRFRGRDPLAGWHSRGHQPQSEPGAYAPFTKKLKRVIKSFSMPDERRSLIPGWVAAGAAAGETGIDLIYSSSAPYSAHLAARTLARDLNIPWVMEMRDLWAGNRYLPQITNPLTRPAMESLEGQCTQEASRIVVLTQAHKDRLIRRRSEFRDRVRVVPNMFPAIKLKRGPTPAEAQPLRLLYAGNLYGGRTLAVLGQAIDKIQGDLPGFSGAVIEVAGRSFDEPWERTLGGTKNRTIHGVLPHQEVVEMMGHVHGGVINNAGWDRIHIPGKFYDYMAAGLPVLDFTHQPDIAGVAHGIAPVWKVHTVEETAEALVALAKWWKENPKGGAAPGEDHGRSIHTVGRKLAAVFSEVVGARA